MLMKIELLVSDKMIRNEDYEASAPPPSYDTATDDEEEQNHKHCAATLCEVYFSLQSWKCNALKYTIAPLLGKQKLSIPIPLQR